MKNYVNYKEQYESAKDTLEFYGEKTDDIGIGICNLAKEYKKKIFNLMSSSPRTDNSKRVKNCITCKLRFDDHDYETCIDKNFINHQFDR